MKYALLGLLALCLILFQRMDGFWSCVHAMDPKRPVMDASTDHRRDHQVPDPAVKNEPDWNRLALRNSNFCTKYEVVSNPWACIRCCERTGGTGVFVVTI